MQIMEEKDHDTEKDKIQNLKTLQNELQLEEDTVRYAAELLERTNSYITQSDKAHVGAATYLACKKQKEPVAVEDLNQLLKEKKGNYDFNLTTTNRMDTTIKTEIKSASKKIRRNEDLGLEYLSPQHYIESYGKRVGVEPETLKEAKEIGKKTQKYDDFSAKSRVSVAAACIYMAAESLKQEQIADVCNTTTKTIYNCVQSLQEHLEA